MDRFNITNSFDYGRRSGRRRWNSERREHGKMIREGRRNSGVIDIRNNRGRGASDKEIEGGAS